MTEETYIQWEKVNSEIREGDLTSTSEEIIRLLSKEPDLSVKEISDRLDYSRPFISPKATFCAAQGILEYEEKIEGRGRPERIYRVSEEYLGENIQTPPSKTTENKENQNKTSY